jgi:hypothetical protein
MGTRERSKLRELVTATAVGTVAASVIWLGGSPELSWLGYVATGLAWSGDGFRCSAAGNRPHSGETRS